MANRGEVVWASDPFNARRNPRPWLVVSTEQLPYHEQESIAVAFTTSAHHPGSIAVRGDAWVSGEPGQTSYVLPWTIATLKEGLHVGGMQGAVTDSFADTVSMATISYLDGSHASAGT